MFILTRTGTIESGVYAIADGEGNTVVQFFIDEDDAISYNTLLGAVDQELVVTPTTKDGTERVCEALGYAYTIIEPGHVVVPRIETLQKDLGL